MQYKESHTFPNGLKIDYESVLTDDYKSGLNNISTQADLEQFVEYWRYLCPGISHKDINVEILKSLITSRDLQDEYAEKAKSDPSVNCYFKLLVPSFLLQCSLVSARYGVPVGTVILQLWNNGIINELPDGTWVIKKED